MAKNETKFAPAARSTDAEIQEQIDIFSSMREVSEALNAFPLITMVLNQKRQLIFGNTALLLLLNLKDQKTILGLRPGEILQCRHSTISAGGCGTTEFCRYCGAVNAIIDCQYQEFVSSECRILAKKDRAEEAFDFRIWTKIFSCQQESFTFFFILNIEGEKRKMFLERIFLHDILNTASALRGFSQLITEGIVKENEKEEFLGRINLLSNRIIDEINEHRQLIAAENNELLLDVSEINIKDFILEIFSTYNSPEFLNGRFMIVDKASGTSQKDKNSYNIMFHSDKTLLSRVIGNMVKNALEASVPGETVRIGYRAESKSISFQVYNPTYMPENIRLQVFNRSFSTKGVGRGLGTYSMKYLTEKYLKGRISFISTEQKGTIFTAEYPYS